MLPGLMNRISELLQKVYDNIDEIDAIMLRDHRAAVVLCEDNLYLFVHRDEYSNMDYTSHQVWDIITDETDESKVISCIHSYLNTECDSEAEHNKKFEENPSIEMALRPYYQCVKVDFAPLFRYTYVKPYND